MNQAVAEVLVECPGCGGEITVPVYAGSPGPASGGTVEVTLTADEAEIELHAMICAEQ